MILAICRSCAVYATEKKASELETTMAGKTIDDTTAYTGNDKEMSIIK